MRIALTTSDVRRVHFWRRYLPILSTIIACSLGLLPIVVSSPVVPDFAFLVLLAWRLLRPEMWSATTPLLLGFFNDLLSGHPVGQSMALWTITFIALDMVDSRVVWRDYWMDWFFASLAIISYTFADWYIGRLMGSTSEFAVMLPQLVASVLGYPIIARLVLILDRWRLGR